MDGRRPEFQEVYDQFAPRIHRYLGRFVGASEAQDLTQEVFVRVSQALDGFRGESRLSTWIYRIATNVALDRLRAAGPAAADRQRPEEAPVADPAPAAEQQSIRKEMNECIRGFVEDLPADYHSVIVLSEFEELTDREIAEVLGISLEAVKIRLHRARARLRRELATGCTLYHDDQNDLACHQTDPPVSFRE